MTPDAIERQGREEKPTGRNSHPLKSRLILLSLLVGGMALVAACGGVEVPVVSVVNPKKFECATEDMGAVRNGFGVFPQRVGGEQDANIHIVRLRTSGPADTPRDITHAFRAREDDPYLSADAQEVTYVRRPKWKPKGEKDVENIWTGDEGVYRVGVNGGGPERIASTPPQSFDSSPVFSPDKQLVAFLRHTVSRPRMGYMDILVVDRSGFNIRNLTRTKPPAVEGSGGYMSNLVISPDGRNIAFTLDREAHVIDMNGQQSRKLTPAAGYNSPSGEDVAVMWVDESQLQVINKSGRFGERSLLVSMDNPGIEDVTGKCPPMERFRSFMTGLRPGS